MKSKQPEVISHAWNLSFTTIETRTGTYGVETKTWTDTVNHYECALAYDIDEAIGLIRSVYPGCTINSVHKGSKIHHAANSVHPTA